MGGILVASVCTLSTVMAMRVWTQWSSVLFAGLGSALGILLLSLQSGGCRSVDRHELAVGSQGMVPDSSEVVRLLNTRYSIERCSLNSYRTPGYVRGVRAGGFNRASTRELLFEFFERNKDVFLVANPRKEIVVVAGGGDTPTGSCIKFGQRFKGLYVFGTSGALCFDTVNSRFSFGGELLPNSPISVEPFISESEAADSALSFSRRSYPTASIDSSSVLAIFARGRTPLLAWRVKVRFEQGQHWGMAYYVDANSGTILDAMEVNALPVNE